MAAILENRQFLVVTAGMFLMQIAQAIAYSVIGFVYIYAAEDVDLIPAFIITMCAGAAISQPLWLALARRFGKYRCYQVATALFVVVTLTWLYLRPGGPSVSWVPFMKPLPLEHALVLVRAVLLGVANGAIAVMPVAMLTDSITEHRASHRAATEGLFSGVYSAVEKLSFAVGPLIAGVVLSLYGFVSSTGGVVPQSASAVRGILLLYSVIPATLQLLSLWVLSGYDKVATQTVTEALGHN
jgi:GPH family glycoside/pentoside/hexuronide:cation symporter